MTSGKVDFVDMSLWDVFKEPEESEYHGKPLISYFTELERGCARLGVAGKIMDGSTAQMCVDNGADFVMIGRGAILHHDFPQRVKANPQFESVARPVTRAYLQEQGVGPAFIEYLSKGWKDFVMP